MSTSTVKGNRKREIGQSPIKKKFKDFTISREDIDDAITNGIKLARREQKSTLDPAVASTVRDAVDSVLTPALRELRADIQADIQATNNSVKELRAELEALASATKQTRDRANSVQAAAREDRRTVTDLRNQLERLTKKMTDIEDRSRRNNVRLVGLPEVAEGSDMAGFLRINLSKWIPSLKGRNIEIDQAHCVYDGRKNSDRPCTLIFRVLRWHDRSEILKGARQAYPVKCTQDNVTLLFFPAFSPATAARRKSLVPVLRTMTALGLQPFLAYPAVIKLRHGGEQRSFDSLRKAEDFISSLSQKAAFAAAPQGNGKVAAAISSARQEGLDGRDRGDAGCPEEGWWREGYGCLLDLFFLSSLLLGYCSYLFDTIVSLLVRLTPPPLFFLEGTNEE